MSRSGQPAHQRRERLIARRKAMGLSQEMFAERLGVDRTTVARWEAGTSEPTPWTRPTMSKVLGITAEDLDEFLRPAPQQYSTTTVAICGSRPAGHNAALIDATVAELARIVASTEVNVSHGPVGIGIEVITYVADQFRPGGFTRTTARFGHANVVDGVDLVLIVGGGAGTAAEAAIAADAGTPVLPFPRTGGAAATCLDRESFQQLLPAGTVTALTEAATAAAYGALVEQAISTRTGNPG
ncbi:helix-turn-helix transcriptional regulator [Myceligenerans salitolerans]|uniref:Helix-turn-helix transcriptional regulator n=1 Tax=Myceligenerans salitolerans TaxID=1230528 RepID=A0ABS3I3K3_9MICO|nr:helix-turn-helix transcriptional regulator [Myceligenerans salitolerans]MBO0607563.1 helix-turn-helix transcriptional regulator [Myceligenerans salitolerans]